MDAQKNDGESGFLADNSSNYRVFIGIEHCGQEDIALNAVIRCLSILLVVCAFMLPGCGSTKGPRVLGILPSPILSPHLKIKKSPEPVCKPVVPAYTPAPPVLVGDAPAEWMASGSHPWEAIVIHHSASDVGGARVFDTAHRARGWDELGYHFVIGNGSQTPDGYVEVGSRWTKQKHGAHCKTPSNYYNDYGIGICLVGDFDQSPPTPAQMQSLRRLILFLSQRYHVSPDHIYGHREVRGTHTRCPGRYFPMNEVRYWVNYNNPIWASTTR